jgi:quinol monooxygenase YgiN
VRDAMTHMVHFLAKFALRTQYLGEKMDRFAILATLEARPGKEGEVEEFLKAAQALVAQEVGTTTWFAFRAGPALFGIFDTFAGEDGLLAHFSGEIAKALFGRAEELFAQRPQIQQLDIFAAKPYGRQSPR